jgi:hypothetical protein
VFLNNQGIELRPNLKDAADNNRHVPQVKEMLDRGMSLYAIGKQLNIPKTSLNRMAHRLGYDVSSKKRQRKDPIKNHAEEIIESYKAGESSESIAKRFDCAGSSITRLLADYGVSTRFGYNVDENFFDVIDTEEKAYTLGFFTADGCNTKQGVMSIRVVDLDVLEKIKRAMSYTGPITDIPPPKKFPHRQAMFNLSICNKRLTEQLSLKGCPPNKTFVTTFPDESILPRHLVVHFIRGLFDGDGSIHIDKFRNWVITIAGTPNLIEPIQLILKQEVDIYFGVYKHGNIHQGKIGGNNQVRLFLDWLYADATIYMQRKYDKYLESQGA